MQNGSLQQECCACCNYVKQVILMPMDLLFVWLYMEFNLYFVRIFFYISFRCDHELHNEYPFKDIKVNLIELN